MSLQTSIGYLWRKFVYEFLNVARDLSALLRDTHLECKSDSVEVFDGEACLLKSIFAVVDVAEGSVDLLVEAVEEGVLSGDVYESIT